MHPYLDALNAMHELLGALGEQHWRSWIAQDIREWESGKSVQHHLSAYGGMGSFNDVCIDNVWLGALFDDLQGACHYFARCPPDKPGVHALQHAMGRIVFELSGWRCLACGCGVIARSDIDYFIARREVRQRILEEAEHTRLQDFVRSVIQRPFDTTLTSSIIFEWLNRSGLRVCDSDDWLGSCPSCGGDNTADHCWSLLEEDGPRFGPSHENLPLRKSAV